MKRCHGLQWPILIGRIAHAGKNHGYCSVYTTGCSLPRGRYLLTPLAGNIDWPTSSWFPKNILYIPVDSTLMCFIPTA